MNLFLKTSNNQSKAFLKTGSIIVSYFLNLFVIIHRKFLPIQYPIFFLLDDIFFYPISFISSKTLESGITILFLQKISFYYLLAQFLYPYLQ